MDIISIIALVVVTIIVLWAIITYNSLVSLRNNVKKAYSGIDVQLKRRVELIPNLIETVKGYVKHEKELLENITKARTAVMNASNINDIAGMAKGENMLSSSLKSLFAVAENYPTLKANENFIKLQEQLAETEDQIAASRRIYNENTTDLNNKIEMFPSSAIASWFKFSKSELFEATADEKKSVKVEF